MGNYVFKEKWSRQFKWIIYFLKYFTTIEFLLRKVEKDELCRKITSCHDIWIILEWQIKWDNPPVIDWVWKYVFNKGLMFTTRLYKYFTTLFRLLLKKHCEINQKSWTVDFKISSVSLSKTEWLLSVTSVWNFTQMSLNVSTRIKITHNRFKPFGHNL